MFFSRLKYSFSILLLLILIGCRNTTDHDSGKVVFRMNLSGGMESLDPAFAKDLSTMWLSKMLYNTLVTCDTALKIQPSLAQSWSVSEDGKTYTFYLKNNIRFHDHELFPGGKGRVVTAHDVVYSFNRIIDPKTASPGAWIFYDRVDSVQPFIAQNDSTFVMNLQKPFQAIVQILSMAYCSVVPHEVVNNYGKEFRNNPVGSGPFKFHLWDEDNQLVLHKNAHYWEQDSDGQKLPYLDGVQISFYDNKGSEFLQFLQGNLHFINGIDGSFKDLVLTKRAELQPNFAHRFKMHQQRYLNTEYLGFLTRDEDRTSKKAIKNRLVRQAINYGIDRQKIVTYFKNGLGIPATGGFTAVGMPGFEQPSSYGYQYNPQKAKELLIKAGYPGGKNLPEITIITPDNFSDIVNFVAAQLKDIGINLKVEVMQPSIVRQQMSQSQASFFRAQWIADYPDAETYLAVFYSKLPAPPNYTRYQNDVFDQLYEKSFSEPDSTRNQLYRMMDSLVIQDAPVVPLYYETLLHLTQKNVSGLMANPMNIIDLKFVKISKE